MSSAPPGSDLFYLTIEEFEENPYAEIEALQMHRDMIRIQRAELKKTLKEAKKALYDLEKSKRKKAKKSKKAAKKENDTDNSLDVDETELTEF